MQAFADDVAFSQPQLVHSMCFAFVSAAPKIVDDKYPNPRQCKQRFPGPLLHKVRRHHSQSGKGIFVAVNVKTA